MDHGTTWDFLLPHAEFVYNNSVKRSNGRSPFEIVTGQQPRTPADMLSLLLTTRKCEGAEDFIQHLR